MLRYITMRFLIPEIQYKMFKFNFGVITNFVKKNSWNQNAKMAATKKVKICNAIEVFYLQNTSEDKKCQTYPHFNDFKVNGRPIYTKGTIYQLMRIKKCIK